MLALAHHIERMVEAGELSGYAETARSLGLTRARMTQVMNLLLLSTHIQEPILAGGMSASERSIRTAFAEPLWINQWANIKRHVKPCEENP